LASDRKQIKKLKAEERKLKRLRDEIAELLKDAEIRLNLKPDKTPNQLLHLPRKFHRIQRHETYYNGRRDATYHGEIYELSKEIVTK